MAFNLQPKVTSFGGEITFLDSSQVRYLRGGVTLDSSLVTPIAGKKVLPAGTFLGRVTTTQKYAQYDNTATDGRDLAVAILMETVDLTEGDQVSYAMDHGRVIIARLPVAPTNAIKTQLSQIQFI